MPNSKIYEGKTTNEAIEKGLKDLKVGRNDVNIKVIENEDKRSFFNILAPRVVKVEITVKEKREDNVKKVEKKVEKEVDKAVLEKANEKVTKFLELFFEKTLGKKADFESIVDENAIKINIKEEGADFLIGYRGETLNSLQTLLIAIADREVEEKIRIEIDVLGYRAKRTKALEELAEKIAKSVVRTRKSIALEPMTPFERKIIHTKLQEHSDVKTASVGEGTHRRVVVSLK